MNTTDKSAVTATGTETKVNLSFEEMRQRFANMTLEEREAQRKINSEKINKLNIVNIDGKTSTILDVNDFFQTERVQNPFFKIPYLPYTAVSVIESNTGNFIDLVEVSGGIYLGRQVSKKRTQKTTNNGILDIENGEILQRQLMLEEKATLNNIMEIPGVSHGDNYKILVNSSLVTPDAIASYAKKDLIKAGLSNHFAEKILAGAKAVIAKRPNTKLHQLFGEIMKDAIKSDSERFLTIRVETTDPSIHFWMANQYRQSFWLKPRKVKDGNGARVFMYKVPLKEGADGNLIQQFPFNRLRFFRADGNKFIAGDISIVVQSQIAFLGSQIMYSGYMFKDGDKVMFPKVEHVVKGKYTNFWRTISATEPKYFNLATMASIEKYKAQPSIELKEILEKAKTSAVAKAKRDWSKERATGADVRWFNESKYGVVEFYSTAEGRGAAKIIDKNGDTQMCQLDWNNLGLPDDGGLGRLDQGDIITFVQTGSPIGNTTFKETILGIRKTGLKARNFIVEKKKQPETEKANK